MGTIRDANQILGIAEASLRELMQQALREQRYSDVGEIARLAEAIARLLSGNPAAIADSLKPSQPTAQRQPSTKGLRSAQQADKAKKATYPRFERDGDRLVKLGWSKKNKEAYEHRAPREAVSAFIRHLASSVDEGKVFMVEELLPVSNIAGGGEIPAYQIYLILAWLRSVGTIDKKGRDGYVLRCGLLADGELDRLWVSLPVRST